MLPPDQIDKLVEKVVEKLRGLPQEGAGADGAGRGFAIREGRSPAYVRSAAPGVFDDLDQAVAAAGPVCVASGLPFLGRHEVRQGTVAYVTAEDEKRLLYRRIISAYRGAAGLSPEEIAAADVAGQRPRDCADAEIGADEGVFMALTVPPLDLPIKTYVANAFRFESCSAGASSSPLSWVPAISICSPAVSSPF